ncbi:MAG TPA: rhodanese-like domain-containing protein [Myxococcota bacterium]|nr:rhodanese-like domain-containing protein [Myxococcota bacterium]
MKPQRIAVKFFAAPDPAAPVDLHPFIGIFHRFIQQKALPGLLVDVADYAHVPDGPGVILIGHEVDYGIDQAGGQTGLLAVRKRLAATPLADAARDALQRALAAVVAIEAEPEAKLRFATQAFQLDVLDRLAAPNDEAAFGAARQALAPVCDALYGAGSWKAERASADDPRKPLVLRVEAPGAPTASVLLDRIEKSASQPAAASAPAGGRVAPKQSPWDISVEELDRLRKQGADFVLVDVREPHEYQICHLDGKLIPLQSLPQRLSELDKKDHVVVHCRTGGRSAKAVELLRAQGFENAWNVQGGILAWIDRIDPSLTRY